MQESLDLNSNCLLFLLNSWKYSPSKTTSSVNSSPVSIQLSIPQQLDLASQNLHMADSYLSPWLDFLILSLGVHERVPKGFPGLSHQLLRLCSHESPSATYTAQLPGFQPKTQDGSPASQPIKRLGFQPRWLQWATHAFKPSYKPACFLSPLPKRSPWERQETRK